MKNQKTYSDMKNQLTAYEMQLLDFRIEQWELIGTEILAYKALQEITRDGEDQFSAIYATELQRRFVFLNELMRDF